MQLPYYLKVCYQSELPLLDCQFNLGEDISSKNQSHLKIEQEKANNINTLGASGSKLHILFGVSGAGKTTFNLKKYQASVKSYLKKQQILIIFK